MTCHTPCHNTTYPLQETPKTRLAEPSSQAGPNARCIAEAIGPRYVQLQVFVAEGEPSQVGGQTGEWVEGNGWTAKRSNAADPRRGRNPNSRGAAGQGLDSRRAGPADGRELAHGTALAERQPAPLANTPPTRGRPRRPAQLLRRTRGLRRDRQRPARARRRAHRAGRRARSRSRLARARSARDTARAARAAASLEDLRASRRFWRSSSAASAVAGRPASRAVGVGRS